MKTRTDDKMSRGLRHRTFSFSWRSCKWYDGWKDGTTIVQSNLACKVSRKEGKYKVDTKTIRDQQLPAANYSASEFQRIRDRAQASQCAEKDGEVDR